MVIGLQAMLSSMALQIYIEHPECLVSIELPSKLDQVHYIVVRLAVG